MPFYWDRPNLTLREQRILENNPWLRVQVLIGEASNWPQDIPYMLFCSNLGYRHRINLATFFWLNGVLIQLFLEVLQHCNTALSPSKTRKFRDLYLYFDGNVNVRERYFAYSLTERRVLNLNYQVHVAPANVIVHNPHPVNLRPGQVRRRRRDPSPVGYHC